MICHDITVSHLFVDQKKIAPLSASGVSFSTIANFAITKIASITEKARLTGRIMMIKVLFTPDLFKYEEEFILEGESLDEVIEKLQEECQVNCLFAVSRLIGPGRNLEYLGALKIEEGKEPKWTDPNQPFPLEEIYGY